MGWRIIYIEEGSEISLHLDNVKIKKGANDYLFPIADLSMVIIDNYKSIVSLNLLNECSKNNVSLITCNLSHLPESMLIPISGYYENCKTIRKQISWSEEVKALIWQVIVKRKITNQNFILKLHRKNDDSIKRIDDFISEVEPCDITNREGLASKMYFRSLFGTNFSRRDETVINGGLNYGYSLFRSLISKVVVAKGLHPNLGIFHRGPTNYFNLADDILEVFRPIVDCHVFENLLDSQIFKREDRIKMLNLLNGKLLYKGQKQTIVHVIEKIVDDINNSFEKGEPLVSFFEPVLYDL